MKMERAIEPAQDEYMRKSLKLKEEKYKLNHFYDIRNDGNYIHETYSDDYESRKMK